MVPINTSLIMTFIYSQENTFLEEISHETYSIDDIKDIDNFTFSYCCNQEGFRVTENSFEKFSNNSTDLDEISTKDITDNNLEFFSKQIDNIQGSINAPQNNDDQKYENPNNTSNSQNLRKIKKKNKNRSNSKSKLLNNDLDSMNATQNNDDQKYENQNNTSNSQNPRKIKKKNKNHSNSKSKLLNNDLDSMNATQNNDDQKYENQNNASNIQNPRKINNKNNNHTNFKNAFLNYNPKCKKKGSFYKKKTQKRNNDEPLLYETKKKCPSFIDYALPKTAFIQQKNTELQFNEPKPWQPKNKIHGINQSDYNNPLVKNNNEFQKSNIRNHGPAFSDFHQHPCVASTSTIQSSDDYISRYNNNIPLNPCDFNRQNKYKLPLNLSHNENEEHFDSLRHENKQRFEQKGQKHTVSPVMPVKQDLCHVQNLQYPQTSVQNRAISEQPFNLQNINKSKILLHYVIKDHLLPVSLNETTVQFSSKKLINTKTRCDIEVALKKHGILVNSWWTPDDMFFATYTLREMAQFVYEMYLKY